MDTLHSFAPTLSLSLFFYVCVKAIELCATRIYERTYFDGHGYDAVNERTAYIYDDANISSGSHDNSNSPHLFIRVYIATLVSAQFLCAALRQCLADDEAFHSSIFYVHLYYCITLCDLCVSLQQSKNGWLSGGPSFFSLYIRLLWQSELMATNGASWQWAKRKH